MTTCNAAEAELNSAKSTLVQKEKDFNRICILLKKGVITGAN
ncbi:MAG: hypothetical protein AB8U25_06335 [Rickettsiales endosymbiont of Dermacentor nuttalli]